MVGIMNSLYSRWSRRPFCSPATWHCSSDSTTSASYHTIKAEIGQLTTNGYTILYTVPWCLDFRERLIVFNNIIAREKLAVQGSNDALLQLTTPRKPGIVIKIHKNKVVEDGLYAFKYKVQQALKSRLIVHYINEFNMEEIGIDAGGLFKDFVTDLSSRIFNTNYGLFATTQDNLLFPNPNALLLFNNNSFEMCEMFEFLGKVLGKCIYENICIQPQFAYFFLAFMHHKYNFMNLINDLSTLDPELHRNLMFLKTYEGDLADLGLTFSVVDSGLGANKEVELIPGGARVDVDSRNRYVVVNDVIFVVPVGLIIGLCCCCCCVLVPLMLIRLTTGFRHRYVNLVAKYYLHDRIKLQAGAFFRFVLFGYELVNSLVYAIILQLSKTELLVDSILQP